MNSDSSAPHPSGPNTAFPGASVSLQSHALMTPNASETPPPSTPPQHSLSCTQPRTCQGLLQSRDSSQAGAGRGKEVCSGGEGCWGSPPAPTAQRSQTNCCLRFSDPSKSLGFRHPHPHPLQETAKIKGKSWGGGQNDLGGGLGQGGVRVCEETNPEMGTRNKIKSNPPSGFLACTLTLPLSRALPLSLFFHLSLRLFSQSLILSRIFSFRNSVFLPVSISLASFPLSFRLSVSICGCGGNEGKQGDKGAPLSPDPWCCPSPPLRVGAGCCPRRGPPRSRAGLIKLIGRGDICRGERLVWLSVQGAEVLGGRRGWGWGWGGAPHRVPPGPCGAGAQPGTLCP